MRLVNQCFYALLLLLVSLLSQAHATESTTYYKLSVEQKNLWRRILLQEDAFFRPKNADYYLSNTATPDMATEFDLAEQYLSGTLSFTGAPDATPWCHFPARFAFVAKVIYGNYFMPEAFRACNLPFPAVDASLKAYLVKTIEPSDSGEALYHVDLLVQGKRFYNRSALALNIEFGQINNSISRSAQHVSNENDAIRLLRSFGGEGEAFIIPNTILTNQHGQQSYRINLPAEKIYFLVLLAYESKRAQLPYSLLRANCHSYLKHIFLAVVDNTTHNQKMFFDFMPTFMDQHNATKAPLFEPYRYSPAPKQQLDEFAKALSWDEYKILQNFIANGVLPDKDNSTLSRTLRLAIGKASEQQLATLKNSPQALALRDEYLSQGVSTTLAAFTVYPPKQDKSTVPVFNSSNASSVGIKALDVSGKSRLQLELDVFNTMADQLQTASPYGFAMGKMFIQVSKQGVAFDHFLVAEENSVGNLCCGSTAYQVGVKKLNGISLDIVNQPQKILLNEWELKPQLELNLTKGIGTISNKGWSAQLLPSISLLTYAEFVDVNGVAKIGWTNGILAISASKLARLYGPDDRRSKPDETFSLEYKVSKDARLELTYQHFDTLGTISGIGYVHAF